MSDFTQYLDLSTYPPFSPLMEPAQDMSITRQLPDFPTYPFPTIGSTLDAATGTIAEDLTSYMPQHGPSLVGSTSDTDATDTNAEPESLASYLQRCDPLLLKEFKKEWGFETDSDDGSGSGPSSDSVWEQAQREAEHIQPAGREEATRQAEAELPMDMDMDMDVAMNIDTHEGANDDDDENNDIDVDIGVDKNSNAGVGFELSFTEFTQLLSPLDYGAGDSGSGSGSGDGSDSTSSSPLSEVPSTPPSSYDPSPSTSAPSSSHAPQASSRKGRTSQVAGEPLVTRAGSRLKPFGADATNEEKDESRRLWGQMSTVLIGQGYALKACRRIPLDEMVQPAYIARGSDPLDAWHSGQNYYPVPSAPELAIKRSTGSSSQLPQAVSRRVTPGFIHFESINQYGPGVALIEALNDRDVANSNSWPAFDFGGNKSGEIIPFWPGYGEGRRIQIRQGMRYGEVARLIAQEYHACWKRWGAMTVSAKEHLGHRIADSRHTRRTTAIDFSQVRLRGLFSLGSGEPYYAHLVVKIP
ncbi:uncharacterized protein STEHIDRAFT_152412 [Stereum hirsutum FP-91666 SS1]|uniref:uncharacterized protein n=1 Tax=Stereum hirsutum (strain FP-91666) TaxID=721885 RepID=UPI0004410647|nr:uncharacterized protein STEHIDRAFT_152412 [Stereum hirsutum FP-91666 SS1]EIM90708.1 hypothetical protein STEHIDRAFT_152412 [Stereum hirsutum FP-91666 SS1]